MSIISRYYAGCGVLQTPKNYKTQGGFAELTDKYLKEEKQTFDALGFPWFFD